MEENNGIFFLYKNKNKVVDDILKTIEKYDLIIPIKISDKNLKYLYCNEKKINVKRLPVFVIVKGSLRIFNNIDKIDEVISYSEQLKIMIK